MELDEQKIYRFPKLKLSEIEQEYLEILYRRFLNNDPPTSTYSIDEIWNSIPADFKPEKMNQLLVGSGKDITLWGIWHVDPDSQLFSLFDKVVYAIRDVIKEKLNIGVIPSDMIKAKIPDLLITDYKQILELMSPFRFYTGFAGSPGAGFEINILSSEVLEQYRTYPGLQIFLNTYLERQGIRPDLDAILDLDANIESTKSTITPTDLYRTPVKRNRYDEIEPVMGVKALAEDLAQIIHELPSEKGQMIGIFGKWGRGKTFLFKTIWDLLKVKAGIKYIKIEYHAWKYQETPASWAYLYEQLASGYLGPKKGFAYITYQFRLIRLNWARFGWLPFGALLGTIFSSFAIAILALHKLNGNYKPAIWASFITILIGILGKAKKKFSTQATELIKKYLGRQSYKDVMGIQADIQEELIKLLKVWVPEKRTIPDPKKKKDIERILLVVEDVDRCTEDKVIQNIDALRVMLEDEEVARRLIVLTTIDERILKNAIRIKYEPIVSIGNSKEIKRQEASKTETNTIEMSSLVSEYLDKVFVIAIKLSDLSDEQKDEFVLQLLKPDMDKSEWKAVFENPRYRDGVPPIHINLTESDNGKREPLGETKVEGVLKSVVNSSLDTNENTDSKIEFENFTGEEAQIFRNIVKSWMDATPRRIGILYYRYLLTKNLLINKYSVSKESNPWTNREGIGVVMKLIMDFGNKYAPEEIIKERHRISKIDEWISILVPDTDFKIRKRYYTELLEILELTVAY